MKGNDDMNKNKELYTCEWKYNGDNAVTIITKIPASEYDSDNKVEQCNSHSGFGFDYYKNLKDAVAHSLVPVTEIQFVNITDNEIANL